MLAGLALASATVPTTVFFTCEFGVPRCPLFELVDAIASAIFALSADRLTALSRSPFDAEQSSFIGNDQFFVASWRPSPKFRKSIQRAERVLGIFA